MLKGQKSESVYQKPSRTVKVLTIVLLCLLVGTFIRLRERILYPYIPADVPQDELDRMNYVTYKRPFTKEEILTAARASSLEYVADSQGIAVVMLNWKRLDNLKLIMQELHADGIYSEFVVWNNNPDTVLNEELIFGERIPERVVVVNSVDNLKDFGKYLGCQRAVAEICYMQDDDWDSSGYRESLLHSFLARPGTEHGVTNKHTSIQNWAWTCYNAAARIHAGFMWGGCGSVFSRDAAVRHIGLIHSLLPVEFKYISDFFFPIWHNEPPVVYTVDIKQGELDTNDAISEETGFGKFMHEAGVLAMDRLWTADESIFRNRKRQLRHITHAIRADDGGLFLTNTGVQRDFERVSCTLEDDPARFTFDRTLCRTSNRLCGIHHQYLNHMPPFAIDDDPNTCYEGAVLPGRPAFFGYDLLTPHTDVIISAKMGGYGYGAVHALSPIGNALNVSISLDAQVWHSLVTPALRVRETSDGLLTFTLDSSAMAGETQAFRAFIVTLPPAEDMYMLQVCHLNVVGNKVRS
ncbi:uncharacterized protein AMSG_02476 [Thecamonas trahens ATCC 50062]|uniref:Uncharacterized protein n=1 Tax=Thecamonas trahens ATCC 50062 TaxID=461836 RepID=A0A0L0D548_THETB|nr:hypothetical protein AMSG_02476 [Thecamonas trahens ATCC 50062]KNC47459.1 hypothetical protein AMSG_02476 [Thecamonas trahens ATCC 50062]|eukprot:XP_013759395.1 hypothetical protein AMSG_02476 [Thecamonas trahens ATCC 50062]